VCLDACVEEEAFAVLQGLYPMYSIRNAPNDRQSPHAFARAERALMSRYAVRGKGRVLEIQGRFRATDVVTRDVCRQVVTEEDEEHICPPDCEHHRKLSQGEYSTIFALDVPATPQFLAQLLAAPAVNEIILALHIHTAEVSICGDQVATWRPKLPGSPGLKNDGSVGIFSIQVPGRASFFENDHAWLALQQTLNGCKPELSCAIGSYSVYRITKSRARHWNPQILPSLWPFIKRQAVGGYIKLSGGVGAERMVRISDELILLRDDRGWFSTNGDDLRDGHDLCSGRPCDEHLRRKLTSHLNRAAGAKDGGRLSSFLLACELHDQNAAQNSWDCPTPVGGWSSLPFAWMMALFSRRTLAQKILSRARGELFQPIRIWEVLFAVVAVIVAVVPWPWVAYGAWFEPHVYYTYSAVWTAFWAIAFGASLLLARRFSLSLAKFGFGTLVFVTVLMRAQIVRISVPAVTLFRERYSFGWAWWGYDTPLRGLILIAVCMALPRLAYAAPDVRLAYEDDQFSPIYFECALPSQFSLPGYISRRPLKPLGEGCKVVVNHPRRLVDVDHPADAIFAVGIAFAGYFPHVSLPCQENLVVALRNRQCAAMPPVELPYFNKLAQEYLDSVPTSKLPIIVDFDSWNSRFPRGRQISHTLALTRVKNCTVSDYTYIARDAFIKVEKVLRIEKGPYDPRLISGASHEFNVVWGPFFFAARDRIVDSYRDRPDNVCLASGCTSPELGAWFSEALERGGRAICGDDQLACYQRVWLEIDGVRHDAHMHESFIKLKWRVYRKLWDDIPRLVSRLAEEKAARTFGRCQPFSVKYEHPYRVRSGDPDTEKGNSVITDFVAMTSLKIVEENYDKPLNEIFALVTAHCLRLGYEIEGHITRNPADVTFLSGFFLPVDGVMYWAPLPGRQLAKIGWSIKSGWLWRDFAGALNSFKDYLFVPFLRVYVEVVSQLIPEEFRLEPPSKRWAVSPGDTPTTPAYDTWDWFLQRYGLNELDESSFKQRLQMIHTLPYLMYDESIIRLVEVDMG
jgi:hypothetical protein